MAVCWSLAMTAKLIQQALGWSVGRAAVSGWDDGLKFITAVRTCFNAPSQVVFGLALVEERVHALGVGVPNIDNCASDGLAVQVAHHAVHEQHFALVGAVVQPSAAFGQRRIRDIERTFDGPRRALLNTSRLVLGVHAQIEKMLETETRREETGLHALA